MKRKKKFTATRWKRELNSGIFIAGLEAIIAFTRETGKEAGFEVCYDFEDDFLRYENDIHVGDEEKVSYDKKIHFQRAAEMYRQETGLHLVGTKEFAERGKTLTPEQYLQETLNSIEWQKRYNSVNKAHALWIDYPITKEYIDKLHELAADIEEDTDGPDSLDDAISVHTHPKCSIVIPSQADIQSLNETRHENREYATGFNPIEVIAGTGKLSEKEPELSPLLILQERTREPLPRSTDFEKIEGIFGMPYTSKNLLLSAIFGRVMKINCMYNIVRGVYSPSTKQIRLNKGNRFGKLCETE